MKRASLWSTALSLLLLLLAVASRADDLESSALYRRLQKYQDIDLYHKSLGSEAPLGALRDGLESADERLPLDINPLHYDISLQVYHWRNKTFLGALALELEALHETASITLHSAKLRIEQGSIALIDSNNTTHTIIEVTDKPDQELMVLSIAPPLQPGLNYTLTMRYQGDIREHSADGIYGFGYVDNISQEVRRVVATQFQATHARYAFPCFDEPDFKARFTLHLARPTNSTAVSNTPLVMTEPFLGFPEYEWDTFETTVKMSTYLVAFVISQYDVISQTVDEINYRVFIKGDQLEEGRYTLEQTPKFLKHFENYYGLIYPFTKLDSVCVERFSAAGMENWGLILYHENAIRITNESNSRKILGAANLIAHEVAHQWFGNLVTPKWWSDIWLNEGFATYMALAALNAVEPDWEAMRLFVSGHQMTALALDSTNHSVPIVQNVSSVKEISSTFNTITYSKGASLIRMMDHFLTKETFRRGIRNYLQDYQYSNAEQDDLWRHLTAVGREDNTLPPDVTVKEIMDTWTLQKHYPVININRHPNGSCTISQKEFSSRKSKGGSTGLWWVPVSVLTEGSPEVESTTATLWLPPTTKSMFVAGLPSHPNWVLLNLQQTAYARVNYDYNNWMSIIRQLNENHTAIPTTTRAQLLDDAYHLFIEGELKEADILFTLMSYLEKEEDYLPWVITIRNMEDIHDHLLYQPEYFELKTYLLKLSQRLYFRFGLSGRTESNIDSLFSLRAQKWTCLLSEPSCTNDLKNYFIKWQEEQNVNAVPSYLRRSVMCTGIREGNSTLWDSVWLAARDLPAKSQHKHSLISALGCSKESWTLQRYLVEGFKRRESLGLGGLRRLVDAVSLNPISHDYAWELIKDSDSFRSRFGNQPLQPHIIAAATRTLNKPRHLAELDEFIAANPSYSYNDMRKIRRNVARNVQWLTRYYEPLAKWLVDFYPFNDIEVVYKVQEVARKSYRSPRKSEIKLIL